MEQEQTVSSQVEPVSPTPQVPKIKNSLVLIMSVLLIVTVAIAGLFYFQIQKLSKELSKYQTQTTPTPTTTPDPTADWKTYTNNYWKISFKYPYTLFKPCLNYATNEKDGVRFWGPDFTCVIGHDILYKIGFVGYDPGKYTEYKKPSSTETITVGGKQAQKKIYIYDESDGPLFGSKQSIEMVIALSNGTIVLQQLGDNLDEQKAFDQILSTFKFLDAESTTGTVCKSINLSLSLTLPNQNWKCKVDNLGKEQKGWDGTVSASSQAITIVITSLGRGPYCNTEQDASCQTVNFFSNATINLDLYKTGGQNKEIFGMIANDASISIKWTGMETRDLTPAEKQEVTNILNSIPRQ